MMMMSGSRISLSRLVRFSRQQQLQNAILLLRVIICKNCGFIKAEKTSVCNCSCKRSELKFSHNKEPSCQGKQDRPPIAISGNSPITPNQNCGLWETMKNLCTEVD
jgi:hypothetical protein